MSWREIFRATFSKDLGARGKISPEFHVENGVKNGKFHANFTLLGRSAEGPLGRLCDTTSDTPILGDTGAALRPEGPCSWLAGSQLKCTICMQLLGM